MKFRKKPVVIEAKQLTNDSIYDIILWVHSGRPPQMQAIALPIGLGNLQIRTLEGNMIAVVGDWIIKGVNGEFYPCKSDVFFKSYEKVNYDEEMS